MNKPHFSGGVPEAAEEFFLPLFRNWLLFYHARFAVKSVAGRCLKERGSESARKMRRIRKAALPCNFMGGKRGVGQQFLGVSKS